MSTAQQPEALRLARKFEEVGFMGDHRFAQNEWCRQAAAELRRQNARIAELESQLADSFRHGWQAARRCAPQWKVVPVEPTGKMISEGSCAQTLEHGHRYIGECAAKTAWSFMLAVAPQPPEGLLTTKPETTPVELPEPVGWFHRHPTECKNGEVCNYRIASGDRKDGWEESPLYTEQQVRALLAAKAHEDAHHAHPAEGVPVQVVELEVDDLIDRLLDAQQDLNLAANIHMDQSIASASTLLDEVEISLRTLAATQPAAQGMDAETQRHAAIGKAIERACANLPEETEIIVSLEKDAGTVTMIDQDGNEHENFSCDYGFAGVMNEAIDAAIAAQAKQGEQE